MNLPRDIVIVHVVLVLSCAYAHASNVLSSDKYAYAQSTGWLSLKPEQVPGGEGVSVTQFHLHGKGWAQSAGWIDFGQGNPDDGLRYSNTSATDCGVNMDVFYNLSGYAYGQSIGWINFSWASESDPNRPRINRATNEFEGYAYAQSIGWINLGAGFLRTNEVLFLEDADNDGQPDMWELAQSGNLFTLSYFTDTDGDGIYDRLEFQAFRSLTFANATSDYDGDGATDREELLAGTSPYDAQSIPPNNSNIASGDSFVYGQSVGWINLKHDRPSAPSGIAVNAYRVRGSAYGQSIGWISFGDGTPANGLRYGNSGASDCGVNLDYKGNLSGQAYGQSVGWINFDWAAPTDPDRPRLNLFTMQFEGYAYGQSVGWIKLGDFNVGINFFEFVPDNDTDGLPDAWEFAQVGNHTTLNFNTDSDGDGILDRSEFQFFRAINIATATSDTDGDGVTDAQEIIYGSDPTDPLSQPPGSGTNVSIDFAFIYGQSVGWITAIHNQPGAPSGLWVRDTHIMGEAWGQSVGWIHFGNGSPLDGQHYSNATAADVGVNVDELGNLSGYAYGQSCGWITFGWAAANHPDRPRINLDTGFLEGYAYGQSIGWVHLGSLKVNNLERPDNDFDGISDAWEFLHFGGTFTAGFDTDSDHDGSNDVAEYFADTDPLDAASHFLAAPQIQGGQFQITFPSKPTRRYTIESSTTLIDWVAIPPLGFAPDAGTSTTKLIPLPSGETKEFYRVNATLPLSLGGGGIGFGP